MINNNIIWRKTNNFSGKSRLMMMRMMRFTTTTLMMWMMMMITMRIMIKDNLCYPRVQNPSLQSWGKPAAKEGHWVLRAHYSTVN